MRIGTRASALALAQARLVAHHLVDAEIVPLSTSGDGGEDGDKARWVDGLEEALLSDRVDLAVHSAKDVPGELPDGLAIVAVPARADARDALCGSEAVEALAPGARVGTSSLRRRAQLAAARDDLELIELRGNVDTRLRKLADGACEAVVLAAAGLHRLGREDAVGALLDPSTFVPAPGQGALAIEARADDVPVREVLAPLNDADALACLLAERALVGELGATCRTPVGAHATLEGNALVVRAFVGLADGSSWIRDELDGTADDPAALGREVADRLLAAGAADLLAAADVAGG